uniref:(California timema) hypothetical protein n=1 Tax=Timema californicum TaxID=61474 RepID=A0A7R9P2I1_TIMCA|nr:unnamed protein product [Timema californicum]
MDCVRTDIGKGKVVSRCCNLGINVISLQFKDIHHAGFTHSSSKVNPVKPTLAAISDKGTALGTTSATVYCLVGSPYTQMFSTTGQVFISASTLPRDTYSPSCNFTKSFLRSTRRNIVSSIFYNLTVEHGSQGAGLCESVAWDEFHTETHFDELKVSPPLEERVGGRGGGAALHCKHKMVSSADLPSLWQTSSSSPTAFVVSSTQDMASSPFPLIRQTRDIRRPFDRVRRHRTESYQHHILRASFIVTFSTPQVRRSTKYQDDTYLNQNGMGQFPMRERPIPFEFSSWSRKMSTRPSNIEKLVGPIKANMLSVWTTQMDGQVTTRGPFNRHGPVECQQTPSFKLAY